MSSAAELYYFEGDFWPNVLEECIRELDSEEAQRRREEEAQAAMEMTDDGDDDIDDVSV